MNEEECAISSPPHARCNHQIRSREMRVIAEDGEQLGILSREEAFRIAQDKGLDLVEVAPNANPPVCRIMDFGKYKYQQQKKQQEARKRQSIIQVKEIKVRPKTDEHDFQTKLKHVLRFLDGGDRVKVTVFFRGREIVHKDRGLTILQRFVEEIGEKCKVDQEPQAEGRTLFMLLSPAAKKPQE